MSYAQSHPACVDPWALPYGSRESNYQLSRQAARRYSVLQALRERRSASRSTRRTPSPAQVKRLAQPSVADSDTPARSEEFTSVS